jgi:hypothetical protein
MIPLSLSLAPLAHADALIFDLGLARGDTIPDEHEYARTLQNEMFDEKKLIGLQIEASYQLAFRPKDLFPSSFLLGLGHVRAKSDESYSGGTLKLERDTTFALLGYRMQYSGFAPNVVLGAEITMIKGLMGKVTLDAPPGSETYTEDYKTLALTVPTFTATAGYQLTPWLLLNAKIRGAASNVPNFFVGVTYDLEHP